jgi:hypothetical protein
MARKHKKVWKRVKKELMLSPRRLFSVADETITTVK